MPTELEEVGPSADIRPNRATHALASSSNSSTTATRRSDRPADVPLFKRNQLEPVKDLKLLVKDYAPIAKDALTILINISADLEVLKDIAKDDAFLELLLSRITNQKEPNANEIAMLLANMAKDDSLQRVLELKRDVPKQLSTSAWAMDQLMDCFVKGAEGAYNAAADFDYLSSRRAASTSPPRRPTTPTSSPSPRSKSSPTTNHTLAAWASPQH
ncbi:hypothetical protein OPT61_g10285 [Boeremia exigua]|uniref:Uncharacterized protein n=1 Tax=Boeremia exigua TaxID=749465 RepID=A0ACC2HQP8_9PLEO|nr:hypothetical protein OPT61_g10285 [Boeremia exigua]